MALIYNLLFTAFVIAATRSSTACPVPCNCTTINLKVSLSCKSEGLRSILSELPTNTSTVELRGNPLKCDCEFYRSWKILTGKGIEIRGKCSDLSGDLSGISFPDLKEGSFACDGSSVVRQKFAVPSKSTESTTAGAIVLSSSSVVSERNSSVVSEFVGKGAIESSKSIYVTTSSQHVPVETSSQAAPVVTSSQAEPTLTSSQVVPALTSSQAVPPLTSSQAVAALTSSQVVPALTSSQAIPPLKSSQAVAALTSSQVAPALTSSQAVPPLTSSQVIAALTSSQVAPALTSSQAVPPLTSSQVVAALTSSQVAPALTSSQAVPPLTSSQVVAALTSSQVAPALTSSQAVPPLTSSQVVAALTSSQVAPALTSSQAVPPLTSSQVVAALTSSQAVLALTSSQVVPALTSSQAVAALTSSQAVLALTSSQVVPALTSSQAVLALTSSQVVPALTSSQAAPPLTSSPAVLEVTSSSTSTVLELLATSSMRFVSSSSVATTPPLQSTGVEVRVTSTADVSPTITDIFNASTAATTPPIMPGSPVITTFDAPEVVGLNNMVQAKCVATGNPPPKIHLTFNNQPADTVDGVTVTSRGSESEIKFKAVKNSEIYCEATNDLGRDKRKLKISVNQNGVKYTMLRVRLINEEFNDNMKNKDSKEFQDLAAKITSQVRYVLSSVSAFLGVSLVKLRPGSVIADILVKTFEDKDDSVEKTLKAEMEKAKLGNIPVDRYKYSFEPSQACPSEFENVTWSDTAYGETDVQPCPRGAQGFAKRNCSVVGDWYYPDYTNCKSDNFVNLRNKMNQSTSGETVLDKTENDILTSLQTLLNLTTPNEDYGTMAGDLAVSTEILELLVDYITRKKQDSAHSEMEVEHVLKAASNVLHLNNEQEFIIAQKLRQTASKFILALERYGLQAARIITYPGEKDLGIIKAENVVMGAGRADPRTISKDVTFPDYQWKELHEVKKKWNATSFVVLEQEMIKSMDVGKNNGIRIAGFLYRTLTRILSFESAYSDKGLAFEINSAVISIAMDPKPADKLNHPITIASRNLHEVDLDGDEPICAFWDFNMNAPHGGWSEEGCNISSFNSMRTTCQCDHMTNFAVLRSKLLPPEQGQLTTALKDFIHCIYIACWIIIAFAGITFLILLILCPWLEPDRTWAMHMCVCASILVTFVLILLGLASYNDLDLCNLYSFLVHYFFLCAFSWILTEAVYVRTWFTERGPRKKYWIGYFFLGWGSPGIAVFITWMINKLVNFESYMSCWMSINNSLIWVFFVPAIVFFVVSCFFFVIIWRGITGLPRQKLKSDYRDTRFRVHIRYCLILMLMFIVTWLVGVLLLTYYWKALLCILFIICCIITGFMLLLFYVIMDRQVRNAFKICCCCWRRSRRGSYWVKGQDDVFPKGQQEERDLEQERRLERQRLVSEGTEQTEQDQDIELNGVDKDQEYDEPLIRQEARPTLEAARPFESSTESFDPLYERVRQSVSVEVRPVLSPEEERPKPEPVYAKVVKPKRPRHPESDSDDEDGLLTPEEREARGIRGLTREQVIRMAKKSDASKKVLKTYESPGGSKEILGGPVYLLNQQELDEELKQFRKFFDHDKPPTTSTPISEQGSSTPSGTFKRETSQRSTVGSPETLEETAIDSSLQVLDRRHDEEHYGSPSRPTAVSGDDFNLRESLLNHFTSTQQQEETGDNWRELLEALKE